MFNITHTSVFIFTEVNNPGLEVWLWSRPELWKLSPFCFTEAGHPDDFPLTLHLQSTLPLTQVRLYT